MDSKITLDNFLRDNLKLPLIYCEKFRRCGVDSLEKMAAINLSTDLPKLGIQVPMHKNKIRYGIENLQSEIRMCGELRHKL